MEERERERNIIKPQSHHKKVKEKVITQSNIIKSVTREIFMKLMSLKLCNLIIKSELLS